MSLWHDVLCQTELHFPNHHPLVIFDEHINFLFVSLSCGTYQLTTVWLIGNVCVSPFKVFHLPADCGGSHT